MRHLVYGLNISVDGYVATRDGGLEWSAPSSELFRWWLRREESISLFLYGRGLWQAMSSYWPTGDEQPGATDDERAFARNWRETPKVVFSSTLNAVDWNTRLVTGDAVAEIARFKSGDGGPMRVGGAALGSAALRAGLVDELEIVTHPVLLGGGAPFFPALDSWSSLELVASESLPGGVTASRYAVQRADGAR